MLTLLNYQIGTQIYESANSLVYRGVREKDNQPVILKVLKEDYPTPEELTRYRQEYEITKSLNIEGVVKTYGIEKYQNTLVIILEDFGGDSLKELIADRSFTLKEFLPLAIQIADSLGKVHTANIIHKDINPSNIVWEPVSKKLKIIDFGIATRLPRENPTLKSPEQLEGTLLYLSPEQTGRMNRSLDYRTDLYSLGVTFYEFLTGKVPFESYDAMELVHCHIAKTPVPVCEVNFDVPQIISDIVMKLMAKNAEDRYQSAFGVKADLEKVQENLTGIQELKGLQFELAQNDFSGQLQIPQKLYGRENEINILLQAFERVSEGAAEIMLVAGYSGVGKTSLVHEVHKPMTEKYGYFAAGKFDQFQKNIPYSAISQAFNKFCRYLLMESAETLDFWQTQILEAVGNNGQVIIDVVPDLELVIGPQPTVAEVGPTEAQNRFNMFFLNFVKALCDKDHPFILFIDDLQWVDLASLTLLKNILLDDEIQHFFIIGAYRDNEVDSHHPFIMAIDELKKANAMINTIRLNNLQIADIKHLLQESLKCDLVPAEQLADLIYQKTQGNAFFTHQFLQTLYSEALLRFDFIKLKWQWDIEQIITQNITANVVDLMAKKIELFPSNTSKALQLAACIGNQFELSILAIIHELELSEILSILAPAIAEGFIQPLDENYKQLETTGKSQFKFLHDRVQQAAYALIDAEQKQTVHLQIGLLLLKNTSAHALENKVFDIVKQFNQSLSLLNNQTERLEVAKLNLIAGQKALDSMASSSSLQYLSIGMKMLPNESWSNFYDLTFSLYQNRAQVEYLNGNFEQAEALMKLTLANAKSAVDKASISNMLLTLYTMNAQYTDAISIGTQALTLLGVELLETDLETAIQAERVAVQENLGERTITSLIHAPEAMDSKIKVAIKLLSNLLIPIYFIKQTMYPLAVIKTVNLSLKYGQISESAFAYSCYGLILVSSYQEYQIAYQFALLGIKLSEKFQNFSVKCKACNVLSTNIIPWLKPIKEAVLISDEGYKVGIQTGELQFAGYILTNKCLNSFYQGVLIKSMLEEIPKFIRFGQKTQNFIATDTLFSVQLPLLNLSDQTTGKFEFHNAEYNSESQFIETWKSRNSIYALCNFYVNKAQLLYLYGEAVQALESLLEAEKFLNHMQGNIVVAKYNFYHSLIHAALYLKVSTDEQKRYWEQLQANQVQMKTWMENCPANFQHKYDLIEAEKARVLGQINAIEWYEKAIAGAFENEYLNEEALAYELAAKFYLERGMEKFAQIYMKEAHYRYQQWGATAKVKDLEERYHWLAWKGGATTTFTGTSTATVLASSLTQMSSSQWLDLDSVMKASQTLSGEIVLSRLLSKMMHIVIENAGAQRGFLLLPVDDNWIIEAEGALDNEEVTVLHSLPFENHLPDAIISYVARTQENVVLVDASHEGLYTENSYIKTHQIQSVLCFPIVYQQQLRAILYFENNLTTGAFTETRLNMLKMLSSQIAISLENAQWVTTLDGKVKERTAQLNAKVEELTQTRQELVQSEKMASLGRLVAGFAHELNTPLGVAVGAASTLQNNVININQLIEQDEVDEEELLSDLDTIDQTAKLTLSNLERAANLVTSFKRTAVDQTSDTVRTFQVQQLIQDTITTLHSHFKKTEIDISLDCAKDFKVKSLPGALEQILTNLLMNSLIHGFEEGQNAGAINIKAQLDGDNLHLEYSDNGKGIATENQEKIFEPFFTTHRAHGGSGLGMYICYNLVTTQLQGTITCESQLGEGVVFKIDYPI
jgi:predicted ATPase/signal transduction histidine kinase/tRNA A-37 threonylcarbamoyl transferase component Bud32